MATHFSTVLLASVFAGGCLAQAPAARTAGGQPDLQGIWTNATLTPLQRSAELGNKQSFTEAEAAAFADGRWAKNSTTSVRVGGSPHLSAESPNP